MNRKNSPNSNSKVTLSIPNIKTILIHELKMRIYSVSNATFLAGFLFFLNFCIFILGDFLNSNLATLSLQWKFLPWLSILFIPALGMRAFEQQKNSGGINLLLSFPITPLEIVLGKWFAGVIILALVIGLTFPFAITVGYLGEPDFGAIVAGYFGALLMLITFYSVTILASSICKEEVTSFLVSASFLVILVLADIAAIAPSLLPPSLDTTNTFIFLASPNHWLDEMATGRISISAILYFFTMTSACLGFACYQVMGYRKSSQQK